MKVSKNLGFILFIAMVMVSGCTPTNANSPNLTDNASPTTIKGKIAVKGNEPKTWVALVGEDGVEYRLKGKLVAQLSEHFQQQIVSLKGKKTSQAKGPGFPAVFEVESIEE